MLNINFNVNQDKCIHCGLCINDCTAKIIKTDAQNFPIILQEDFSKCIKCQHCLAICPTEAISILDKDPKNSSPCNNFPSSEQLLNLIQSRRSFRSYKHENLDPEIMQKLKEVLKYPPTGCNFHNLQFSIIDDVDVMDRFRNRTNNKVKKILLSTPVCNLTGKLAKYKKAFLSDSDVIFRGAPHMVVVSTPLNAPCGNQDGIIALSYFELYAQSLGIGTLWCGFAQICLKLFPELCEFLEIPDGFKPVYVMLFGATDLKYQRTTQPDEYKIISIKGDKPVDNLSFYQKVKRYFWNSLR